MRKTRTTKKKQILELYLSGQRDLEAIARSVSSSISYVASVLRKAGWLSDYYDLYTTSSVPMNLYAKELRGRRLGFKDVARSQESVKILDQTYRLYEKRKERAGQHHILLLALTLYNRARWSGKVAEAEPY